MSPRLFFLAHAFPDAWPSEVPSGGTSRGPGTYHASVMIFRARAATVSGLLLGALLAAGCASDEAPGSATDHPPFDGAHAMALVDTQVAFGPRIPGFPGHARQAAWMAERLQATGAELVTDRFIHVTREGDTLELSNLMARARPEATRRILLLTHWDTRPTADRSLRPEDRTRPVPGANDGGSGTAVLMELARVFSEAPPPVGVDLLFVDGEDYGARVEDMLLGSKRYAASAPDPRPVYGVLLDMVGDEDPSFPPEPYSMEMAPVVVRKLRRAAQRVGYDDRFPLRVGTRLVDDHLPLNQAGIPTADLVDFEYGPGNRYWHTTDDTPDRVRARSLELVGEVLAELVYSGG